MEWTNPFYDQNNAVAGGGNVRYDENAGRGVNIPGIKNYAAGAKTFGTYQALKPGQSGYGNAQNYLSALQHNTGITDWTKASDEQLFNAIDDTFQGYQEDNKKENFGFDDIAGYVGPAVGFATGNPWLGAAAGGISGGATGGLKGAALGALGGYTAGSSGLFGGDGFIGGNTGPLKNFLTGNGWSTTLASAGAAPGSGLSNISGKALNSALPGHFGVGTPMIHAGTGAGGLGVAAPYAGIGSAVGAASKVGNFLSGASGFADKLSSVASGLSNFGGGESPQGNYGPTPGSAVAGGVPIINALATSNPPESSGYNYELADPLAAAGGGGGGIQGGSLRGSAGAGGLPEEQGRVPGYQRKPFANYLLRAA